MRQRLAITSMLVLALGVIALYAQTQHARVQIPFNFSAGGKEMPAGTYSIREETANSRVLLVRNVNGSPSALCQVLTRLGPAMSQKPEFVFDKVGETRILSEVYMPGVDGYQLAGTKEEHTHQKLTGEAAK